MDVNTTGASQRPARLDDVEGATHVHVTVAAGILHGGDHARLRGEVVDGIGSDPGDHLAQGLEVDDVLHASARPRSGDARGARPRTDRRLPSPPSPSASRASTTCEPMKPAPPVTIARCVIRRKSIPTPRSRPRRAGHSTTSDRLVDPLEHPSARAAPRQAAADRGAAEHDRHARTGRAQLAQRVSSGPLAGIGRWRRSRSGRGAGCSLSASSCSVERSVSNSVWKPAAASWSWTICSPSVCESPRSPASSTRSRVGSVPTGHVAIERRQHPA